MRLARGLWVACAIAVIGGCTTRSDPADGGSGIDAPHDAGVATIDAGRETCTSDSECDDGFACTIDTCVVGNVCDHVALDSACAAEERCVVGRGCVSSIPTECELDADCDDGAICNGTERCLGPAGERTCVAGSAFDCDDGNTCTTDACDDAIEGCRYTAAPGCDAGTSTLDGGTPCEAFATADYVGSYTFRPSAAAACTGVSFNVSEITVSVSGDVLTVRADRFTLTQSPAPTDGTFDARFSDGCATVRLEGAFTCADRWTGTWTASFGGACSCSPQNLSVRGSRR
jgi:hypothetical protein